MSAILNAIHLLLYLDHPSSCMICLEPGNVYREQDTEGGLANNRYRLMIISSKWQLKASNAIADMARIIEDRTKSAYRPICISKVGTQ